MNPGLAIRSAAPEDIPVVLAFVRELAEYEQLTHLLSVTEARLTEELFGARSNAEALLGYSGAEPAAFAVYFHNFSTFLGRRGLYLEDLYVRPAFRRRGYGRAMLAALARIAQERGCGRFEWAVLDWNTPAIDFYRSIGADLLEEWRVCRITGAALERLAAPDRPADPQK